MSDPIYVAQTFDPEHCDSQFSKQEWFRERAGEASEKGATFGRYSVWPDGTGLLIEGWTKRPADQGEQRWAVISDE
tara:strand:+ start:730 stop:957 length:228 start_codon:yes stop_codon:yes gene_type:complete